MHPSVMSKSSKCSTDFAIFCAQMGMGIADVLMDLLRCHLEAAKARIERDGKAKTPMLLCLRNQCLH